jgi:hypothetical protein
VEQIYLCLTALIVLRTPSHDCLSSANTHTHPLLTRVTDGDNGRDDDYDADDVDSDDGAIAVGKGKVTKTKRPSPAAAASAGTCAGHDAR